VAPLPLIITGPDRSEAGECRADAVGASESGRGKLNDERLRMIDFSVACGLDLFVRMMSTGTAFSSPVIARSTVIPVRRRPQVEVLLTSALVSRGHFFWNLERAVILASSRPLGRFNV